MRLCTQCGSSAINPGTHGRDAATDLDLCDVCYWRKRAYVAMVAINEMFPMQLPASFLEGRKKNTALILYRDADGAIRDLYVDALPGSDNEDTLRARLRLHAPEAEFIGWVIK